MSGTWNEMKWAARAGMRRAFSDFFSPIHWLLTDKPYRSGMTSAEYSRRIAEGLSAADKAKADLAAANRRVEKELVAARNDAGMRIAQAERLAQQMIEEAKDRAASEGARIVAAARAEAELEAVKARELLREQVAQLAIKGAEQILKREVEPRVYKEILRRLKTEL